MGLYFHGLVKTAHKMFPKKYLQQVEIVDRGGHVVLTSKVMGVDLRAVTWNDGKKTKKLVRSFANASSQVAAPRYQVLVTENGGGPSTTMVTRTST